MNIFDCDWQTTGKRVKVQDPIYHQDHTFEVWQVEIDGQIRRFAAGEFSNCVWGVYLEKGTEGRGETTKNTPAGGSTSNNQILKTLHRLSGGLYCAAGHGE